MIPGGLRSPDVDATAVEVCVQRDAADEVDAAVLN
jgi:hypothetical protein